MIRHIVTWKLTAEDTAGKASAFDELAQVFGPLPSLIPQIKALHLGRDLGETPDNWDVVVTLDFGNTAALAEYQSHPEHEPVRDIIRRVTANRSAIDFEF
jgi:Stress responsive A/B Barrel Domain